MCRALLAVYISATKHLSLDVLVDKRVVTQNKTMVYLI